MTGWTSFPVAVSVVASLPAAERALAAAQAQGVTFVENTGDGSMMTFPSALAAANALLRELRDRPPEMAPAPSLEVRAATTYGQILPDACGGRHGATINEAFRLMGVPGGAFVTVEGEESLDAIPDWNRVFLDEDAANELGAAGVAIRHMGVCASRDSADSIGCTNYAGAKPNPLSPIELTLINVKPQLPSSIDP